MCNDIFPTNPDARVKLLYEQIQELRHNTKAPKYKTGEIKGLQVQLTKLCIAIAVNGKFQTGKSSADNGYRWPTDIDFTQLHERILDLDRHREIWGLLANAIVLQNAVSWQTFIDKIASEDEDTGKVTLNLFKWSNMPAMQKFNAFGDANFAG
jgi:hypothetical protein